MNTPSLNKFDETNRVDTKLKVILIISNMFSGLLSFIATLIGKYLDLYPAYISNFQLGITLLVTLAVFITSLGVWFGKGKYNSRFLLSLTLYYVIYIHFRYEAVIYNTVTPTNSLVKISFATVWLLVVWIHYYSRFYNEKVKETKTQ